MKRLPKLFALEDKLNDIDVRKIRKQVHEDLAAEHTAKVAERRYFQLLTSGAK